MCFVATHKPFPTNAVITDTVSTRILNECVLDGAPSDRTIALPPLVRTLLPLKCAKMWVHV